MFQGFTQKTGEFFWELSFNNERPWFQAHKEEYDNCIGLPFKALALDTQAAFEALVPGFDTQLHISRIYRDARRLFGRGPYKDHLWFSLKSAELQHEGPVFWFEIDAVHYAYGLGFYSMTTEQMQLFRNSLDANPARFMGLARPLDKLGYIVDGEAYKRPKKLHDDALLDRWYNRKCVGIEKRFDLGGDAFSDRLPQIMAEEFKALMPLFDYFMEIYRQSPGERT